MEVVSASGKHLGGSDLDKALEAFAKLPESERAPGAVKVGDLGPADTAHAAPALPAGALAVKLYGRLLARDPNGALRLTEAADFPLMAGYDADRQLHKKYLFEAQPDYLWLTEAEWTALVPAHPKVGDRLSVPPVVVRRICTYHLIPQRLYGEGGGWSAKDVRAAEMALTVEEATSAGVRLRLSGSAKLGSTFDAGRATTPNGPLAIGYEPRFDGVLFYDTTKGAFTRFDFVAIGDAWGRMGDANGKSVDVERPGRWPLGFAFERAGDAPADRLTPAGRAERIRSGRYLAPGK